MDIKKIENQFNLIAKEYDENRRKFISCFNDYYISTTDFIATSISKPETVLDLGSGTGLLPSFWYKYFPDSNYVLCDIAEDMLAVARKRFSECGNVSYKILDYTKQLPKEKIDLVISALSIHHLEHTQKEKLFKSIYEILPDGGAFVNYDQFCVEDETVNKKIEAYWISEIKSSGISEKEYDRWLERRKLDRECSIQQEITWLKKAGFNTVECVYSKGKFAVIFALK